MANPSRRYFISYSRADAEVATRLAEQLREKGVNLWIDRLDIAAGDRWDSSIEEALQECPGLMVLLSKTSVASENVLDEVSYALEENEKVIPILIEPCDIPFRLRRLQYIDLVEDYEKGVSRLLRDIGLLDESHTGQLETGELETGELATELIETNERETNELSESIKAGELKTDNELENKISATDALTTEVPTTDALRTDTSTTTRQTASSSVVNSVDSSKTTSSESPSTDTNRSAFAMTRERKSGAAMVLGGGLISALLLGLGVSLSRPSNPAMATALSLAMPPIEDLGIDLTKLTATTPVVEEKPEGQSTLRYRLGSESTQQISDLVNQPDIVSRFNILKDENVNSPSNAILFGKNVPTEEVKLVASTLIERSVEIKVIQRQGQEQWSLNDWPITLWLRHDLRTSRDYCQKNWTLAMVEAASEFETKTSRLKGDKRSGCAR